MRDEQAASDSAGVLSTLLANHRRFLSFLEPRVGSRDVAEEILQAAFVRSVQKSDEIREPENAVAWFYRLLRNAIVDHYRTEAAGRRAMAEFVRQLSDPAAASDLATERAICECIHDLIPSLKPEYRELIRRVDLEGVEVSSAAESLGITAGNARVRLHRARKALRQELEQTCRTCAAHGCIDCNCSRPSPAR